jgi:hypothetical protein
MPLFADTEKEDDPLSQIHHHEHALKELQKMNQNLKEVNNLFNKCQMKNECIMSGLQDLVMNNKENFIAKTLLENYVKQEKLTMKALEACYEIEKGQVNDVITNCSSNPKNTPECTEKKLLQLVHQGNALAEMTLLKLYKSQNDMSKVSTLQRELAGIKIIQQNNLEKCLEAKTK